MTTKTPVSVLGLGRMGATAAEIFVRNGHPTTVWNRTPAKASPLVAQGAVAAGSATEALSASPVSLLMLADDTVVRSVLEPAKGRLSGRALVNLTTGRPVEARELGRWLNAQGVDYLDGGMLSVPETLGTPDSVIIYSGDSGAEERYRDLLSQLGTPRYFGADHGLAALNDMSILAGMYGLFAGYFQSVAMVDSEGIRAAEFTEELLVPWLRSILDVLPVLAAEIDSGQYPVNFSSLDINVTGIDYTLRTSREQGVDDSMLEPLRDALARQLAAGHGRASFSRAVEELRPARRAGGAGS